MQVFSGHTGPVQVGTFTPDGKRLLTGSGDGSLIAWDPRTASAVWKLSGKDARFGMEHGITALAVNAAGTVAVVGGANGEVRVINLGKGDVVGKLDGHGEGESVEAIEFMELGGGGGSTNAGVVVTGGTDGRACIWDLTTMRLRASVAHSVSRGYSFVGFCSLMKLIRRTRSLHWLHTGRRRTTSLPLLRQIAA